MSPMSSRILGASAFRRADVISAIADLALAARAGELVRRYQREWSWIDKQNFIDAVDADEFNETFHGIEREFDRLAEALGMGGSNLLEPWQSGEITLTAANSAVLLAHNLGTQNLLVDLQLKPSAAERETIKSDLNFPELDTTREWWGGLGISNDIPLVFYVLPDPDHILLMSNANARAGAGEVTVRAIALKW